MVQPREIAERSPTVDGRSLAGFLPRMLNAGNRSAAGPNTVAFLREQLRPIPAIDANWVQQLIYQLDDGRFASRENASRALQDVGPTAEPLVRQRWPTGLLGK
jgi:hypothetical protein